MTYIQEDKVTMLLISLIDLIFASLEYNLFSIVTNSTIIVFQLGSSFYGQKNTRMHFFFDLCLVMYYCISQLITRGILSIWFIAFTLGNERQLVQFAIIPLIMGFTWADVKPMKTIDMTQLLLEQTALLSSLLYEKFSIVSSRKQAENVLTQQILQNTIFKVVDLKQFDQDENEIDTKAQCTQHVNVYSARSDKLKLSQEPFEEIKIKCFPILDEQQCQIQKPVVFRNIKDFIQIYRREKSDMDQKLIIAQQQDRSGQKQYYRLLIEDFRHFTREVTLVAFIKQDQNLPLQRKTIDKFKHSLSKIFTHKLKTPLNTTLGFLQAAVMENTKINESIKQNFLKPAFINSKIQYYSVQDMLDYVNQAELISYKVTKVNLHKTLSLIFDLIELQCRAKKIQVEFRINSEPFDITDKPIYLITDQLRLERILFNLLNKSYRHTQMNGSIILNVEVCNETNRVYFTINDNVLGFKQDQIEYINSQAHQQNISTGTFRNSILKRYKFKFSLTLQITNKLIYILSDSQCSLQIRSSVRDGADYHFFISLNSQRTGEPSMDFIQNKSQQINSMQSLKNNMPNHLFLMANTQTPACRDQNFETLDINHEPQPNKPLQLSTQMHLQSPKSTLLKSNMIHNSIVPLCKSVYQKEINDKSMNISMGMDYQLNYRKVVDSVDIRQDTNQTIMLVDDEPFNHDTLKIMLRSLGFKNFISAFNGQECIELVEKHHKLIKMIFMDLDMPIMGGLKATTILVQMMENFEIDYIPIVACTAHDDQQTQYECIEAGMLCVIAKPVFLRSLQEAFVKVNEVKSKSQNLYFGSKVISSSIK